MSTKSPLSLDNYIGNEEDKTFLESLEDEDTNVEKAIIAKTLKSSNIFYLFLPLNRFSNKERGALFVPLSLSLKPNIRGYFFVFLIVFAVLKDCERGKRKTVCPDFCNYLRRPRRATIAR